MVVKQKKHEPLTHNIKKLGFSGLRGFGSRSGILVDGQEVARKPTVSYCKTLADTVTQQPAKIEHSEKKTLDCKFRQIWN